MFLPSAPPPETSLCLSWSVPALTSPLDLSPDVLYSKLVLLVLELQGNGFTWPLHPFLLGLMFLRFTRAVHVTAPSFPFRVVHLPRCTVVHTVN